MNDAALVARVRAEVAASVDPGALLAVYADRKRRALLRERVRAAAGVALDDDSADALCAELFGFGPLQSLLDDPLVTDVLVNGPGEIFVERAGVMHRTDVRFRDAADLSDLVYRIASSVGRELTIERPYVDARMRDGSRANAVIAPVGGPCLCIRKFGDVAVPLSGPAGSWVGSGALTEPAADLLVRLVRRRANIIVSGATGSGKSTLLRALAAVIPADERLIVIEDTNELVLPHPHVVRLECVPATTGNAVHVADLVANALRMRPDRIIVGEVRTPREASALLEALSTGHDGALTTLHARSARDALLRLELLLARTGELAPTEIAAHVARCVDAVVHVERTGDGRAVSEIGIVEDGSVRRVWTADDAATLDVPARWTDRP